MRILNTRLKRDKFNELCFAYEHLSREARGEYTGSGGTRPSPAYDLQRDFERTEGIIDFLGVRQHIDEIRQVSFFRDCEREQLQSKIALWRHQSDINLSVEWPLALGTRVKVVSDWYFAFTNGRPREKNKRLGRCCALGDIGTVVQIDSNPYNHRIKDCIVQWDNVNPSCAEAQRLVGRQDFLNNLQVITNHIST